jgi:hypothetical protein
MERRGRPCAKGEVYQVLTMKADLPHFGAPALLTITHAYVAYFGSFVLLGRLCAVLLPRATTTVIARPKHSQRYRVRVAKQERAD